VTASAPSRLRGPYRALRRLAFLAQSHADRIARAHGLTMQQWELLAGLRRAGGALDQRELGCAFRIAPPTLTSLLDGAEERGLVTRGAHPDDRRRRRVVLTPAGDAAVRHVPHLGRAVAAAMTQGFTPAEREQLVALLERAAGNLEAQRGQEAAR
jgi:MarR family transcriptional regulator for hemolysin